MKIEIYSPARISLLTSIIVTLLLIIFYFLLFVIFSDKLLTSWIWVIVPLMFAVSFVVSYFFISKLLIHKIYPLYKIISQPKDEESFKKSLNILKKANVDVANWVVQKNNEIDRLKKNEKFRREFLSNVSHELKTPLFSIQGYITTLLDGGIEDAQINRTFLEKAEKNVNRMISIIQDLENISSIENGELKLNYENFDITVLIREMFEMLENKANKRGIKFFLINPTKTFIVKADRQRIADVIYNLLLNSINYGKDNGKTTVYIHDLNEKILVEISDNGIGIEEKYLDRIFERFFRVDKSRSREHGGTGLGLAIVKHILESHNQTIYVKSTYGVGSSFSFTLDKA
ncbi:MAG: ATP-binding protein [Bacteroidales bacterium]|nr:ATP-binding protein [Bacteroidales bacterium]